MIAILAVVSVGAVSASHLGGLIQRRPGGSQPAGRLADGAVLMRGTVGGVTWSLSAGSVGAVPCTQIEIGGRLARACWPELSQRRPRARVDAGVHRVDWIGTPDSRAYTFVVAVVPRTVADVVVGSSSREFHSGRPVEAPSCGDG